MSRDRRSSVVPLAFLAFVSLGLPDGVLGVAWPSLRRSFDRPIDQLGLILLAMAAGYLASSFSAGAVLARLGVGRLLVASSLLVAASAVSWAAVPWWPLVVAGGFVSGLGAGASWGPTDGCVGPTNEDVDVVFDAVNALDWRRARRLLVPGGLYLGTAGSTAAAIGTGVGAFVSSIAGGIRVRNLMLRANDASLQRLAALAAAGVL